jgi:hypothetical protein
MFDASKGIYVVYLMRAFLIAAGSRVGLLLRVVPDVVRAVLLAVQCSGALGIASGVNGQRNFIPCIGPTESSALVSQRSGYDCKADWILGVCRKHTCCTSLENRNRFGNLSWEGFLKCNFC